MKHNINTIHDLIDSLSLTAKKRISKIDTNFLRSQIQNIEKDFDFLCMSAALAKDSDNFVTVQRITTNLEIYYRNYYSNELDNFLIGFFFPWGQLNRDYRSAEVFVTFDHRFAVRKYNGYWSCFSIANYNEHTFQIHDKYSYFEAKMTLPNKYSSALSAMLNFYADVAEAIQKEIEE